MRGFARAGAEERSVPRAALCLGCGLCCDGTLFTRVVVRPVEAPPPVLLRGQVQPDGAVHVPQRCAAHGASGCAVYDARPGACREFDCLLLGALTCGEVSLDEARDVVAEARARRTAPDAAEHLRFHFTGQRSTVR